MGCVQVVLFLLHLLLSITGSDCRTRIVSVVKLGPGQYKLVEGKTYNSFVYCNFTDYIDINGWSYLEIRDVRNDTDDRHSDNDVAYAAGIAEANVTAYLIQQQWENTFANFCKNSDTLCDSINTFFEENWNFIGNKMRQPYPDQIDRSYWYQIYLFRRQLTGLMDGYNMYKYAADVKTLPDYAFKFFQLHGDFDDLKTKLGPGDQSNEVGSGSCSALIKVLENDLLVGHSTWTSYYNMLRIFKIYAFRYNTFENSGKLIPGAVQLFPSYPGRLYSGDDFYLINSGLLSMETSIKNYNPDLWKFVTTESVFENIRAIVANRLATSGDEWTQIFSKYNSGTYNNQWMILDYNKFTLNKGLLDNLLWIVEQMPNLTKSEDVTPHLRNNTYWASYNIPYFDEIYDISGTKAQADKYGDWFTWDKCPRAKIFARNQTDIGSLEQMQELMRYNNFKTDDLSKCDQCKPPYSAVNAIAARSDLNPKNGTYPFKLLGHSPQGAIDAKVLNSQMFRSMQCKAVSGPTDQELPPFQWSTSGFGDKPIGQPDLWNFPFVSIYFP